MEEIERPVSRQMYSEEEARQILDRAMGLQVQGREFSREHLEQMARDLGISTDQLQNAEQNWLAERETSTDRQAFIAQRRREFRTHLVTYVIVNVFLFVLNIVTFTISRAPVPWFLFPLLGWGVAIALQAWNVYQTEGDDFDRDFMRWQQKKKLRQQHYRELSP
ncbi:MAG: 2TM domain-containing protein [Ardenticatenales bacterium]|nr:2TM domain-containing protein [Ardenticatenales bacterium]